MDPDSTQQILLFFGLVCLSAFFTAAETAFFTLSKVRLIHLMDSGAKGAKTVNTILKNPQKMLCVTSIGDNFVNIMSGIVAVSSAIRWFKSSPLLIAAVMAAALCLIFLFGEMIPQIFARQNAEKVSLWVSWPLILFTWLLNPLVVFFTYSANTFMVLIGQDVKKQAMLLTEEELKTMVEVSHEEGLLEYDEKDMIHKVVRFGDRRATDIMIPRTHICAISLEAGYSEVLKIFSTEQYSRMPVFKESMDNIVGILYVKDLLMAEYSKESFKMDTLMRKPYFTYESKPLSQLFTNMRTGRIPMAIVLDEYGGTCGLITLEDLIEEIVGDIDDEYDESVTEIQKIDENAYLINGETRIQDVNEKLGLSLYSDDFDSIGGYVMGVINRIPLEGESIYENNLHFKVEQVHKNRVTKIHLYIMKKEETIENKER